MSRERSSSVALFVALATFVMTTAVAIGVARDDDGSATSSASSTEASSTEAAGPVTVHLTEFGFDPDPIVASGALTVVNTGTIPHNLTIEGTGIATADLQGGDRVELDLSGLEPGTYTVVCTVPGHAASGMTTELTIPEGPGDDGSDTDGDGAAGHGGHGAMTDAQMAEMDRRMIESIEAFPAATEGRGNQVLAPEVLPDGTKRFELTAAVTPWEVEPGKVVDAWTYNGMVPGPMFVLDVGDTIEVELTNELPVMTDIHWHGQKVPNDQDGVAPLTQDPILPGETYTYRFTVPEPAVAMYHAHAHGDVALPNGLVGAFIVGDPPVPRGRTVSGIPVPADVEVAQRIPMVVNDAGVLGLTLNGKSFPATEPVTAEAGDWLVFDYFNEGLMAHPMHLHGFEQIVIAKDGEPLDVPYAADTIDVAPGERYTVLVHADQPGVWVWHCHILNHVEGPDGMFGMVTAVIVS